MTIAALCFSLIHPAVESLAGSQGFGPWSVNFRHPVMETVPPADKSQGRSIGIKATDITTPYSTHEPSAENTSFFVVFFKVWSGVLTKIDGPRCSHKPTCSMFTKKALAVHGLLLGFWIALQRLTRGAGSSPIRTLPESTSPGRVFYIDDLNDYEFWRKGYSPWSGWKK